MVAKKGETPAAPLAFWYGQPLGVEARLLSLPGMEMCSLMQVWFGTEFGDASSVKMLQGWLRRCSAGGGRAVNWICKTWREWEPTNLVLTAWSSVGKQNHDDQIFSARPGETFPSKDPCQKDDFFSLFFLQKEKGGKHNTWKTLLKPTPVPRCPVEGIGRDFWWCWLETSWC